MGLMIWGWAAAAGLSAAWLALRRPLRLFREDVAAHQARARFRMEREWLEARFLGALNRTAPLERARWEDAQWHDEVVWARDRQTRVFLALIAVHFDPPGFEDLGETAPRHATALFEFRKGRWQAEGKWLDETRPDEAVLRNQRFELVLAYPRRAF